MCFPQMKCFLDTMEGFSLEVLYIPMAHLPFKIEPTLLWFTWIHSGTFAASQGPLITLNKSNFEAKKMLAPVNKPMKVAIVDAGFIGRG